MTAYAHTPSLAGASGDGPRRSLILAGGGMRVAYQAGVLLALQEAGLTFSHADGTSGGTMNLSMLLSGVAPEEMCRRWMTLNVRDFSSPLPISSYLRPARLMGLSDADGLARKIFPHLGIDPPRIRAAEGIEGTFNVCNYNRKTNEAIPHRRIDMDFLVAALTLPIVMPPVGKDGTLYLDSAWIKDANLTEAVRRGAEELWLVWCIGNVSVYRAGVFNQYVHMMEMSAGGGFTEEIGWIADLNARIARGEQAFGQRRPITLHVIHPEYPLPLDPDFYFNRVDAATLISTGYGDAWRAIKNREGDALHPEAIRMTDPKPGIAFRETMSGGFTLGETDPKQGAAKGREAGNILSMHGSIDVADIRAFVADPTHTGKLRGTVDFGPMAKSMIASDGVFRLFSPSGKPGLKYMVYEMAFRHQGRAYYLAGKKDVKSQAPWHLWGDTTTLYTRLHEGENGDGPVVGAGVLSLGVGALFRLMSTFHGTNAETRGARISAASQFFGLFLRELVRSYLLRR